MRYDPEIGIFGMNVAVTFEKPGYRIKRRKIQNKKVPNKHQVTKEETMQFSLMKTQVTLECSRKERTT